MIERRLTKTGDYGKCSHIYYLLVRSAEVLETLSMIEFASVIFREGIGRLKYLFCLALAQWLTAYES